MSLVEDVISALRTPIPLPDFLTKPIILPALSDFTSSRATPPRKIDTKEEFNLEGTLTHGDKTPYALNGRDLSLTSDTWIFGNLASGAKVRAKCQLDSLGDQICISIVVVDR